MLDIFICRSIQNLLKKKKRKNNCNVVSSIMIKIKKKEKKREQILLNFIVLIPSGVHDKVFAIILPTLYFLLKIMLILSVKLT